MVVNVIVLTSVFVSGTMKFTVLIMILVVVIVEVKISVISFVNVTVVVTGTEEILVINSVVLSV